VINLRNNSGIPRFCTAGCAETVYLSGVTETLTSVKAGPGGVLDPNFEVPMLATSWKIDPSLKFMDFEIRKGVPFHDAALGEMTPEDVAFSFNDANSAVTKESIHGQAGDFAPVMKRFVVTGPQSVRLEFTTFYSATFRHLGPFYQSAGIVSKKLFDQQGVEGMRDKLTVGTGPFRMVEWSKSERLAVEAVENHWRKTPSVKQVRFLEIPEAAARVAMLETGEAQISGELPFKDVVRLQKTGKFKWADAGLTWTHGLQMAGNYWDKKHPVTGEPLDLKGYQDALAAKKPWVGNYDDPASMERARKVRWALALAIDREGINKGLVAGLGRPCYLNQVSITHKGWNDKWKIPYDPVRARQLLKEAGYEKGFEVDLWADPQDLRSELGDALAGLWATDLNVTVKLDKVVFLKFRPGLVQRTTSTLNLSPGDEGKAGFPLSWPKGFQGSAWTRGGWGPGFEDPVYAQTFLKMTYELDEAKRQKMAEEWVQYAYDQMLAPCIVEEPKAPLYNAQKVKWEALPNQNSNISNVSNLETAVLTP
jgi:ABC-type transport system substrate-binding protein